MLSRQEYKRASRRIPRAVHACAFTLVELLVVVAVIMLLVCILAPSMRRAQELTRRIICGNNLRQMHFGFQQWVQSHSGKMPSGQVVLDGAYQGVYAIYADYWNNNPDQGRYRGHGVIAAERLIDPRMMYCPSWTWPYIQLGEVSPPPIAHGPWWDSPDLMPSHQAWMQTGYHYRSSFDAPNWRAAIVKSDGPETPYMADAFSQPSRGVDYHHLEGYSTLYLGGHVWFLNDPDFTVRDWNGGEQYFCGYTEYCIQEKVWKQFFTR